MFIYILSVNFHNPTSAFVLVVLEEDEVDKVVGKDENVHINIHAQMTTKYLCNEYKPDVDSDGTHAYFTFRLIK